ncbi:beta-1,3-galactosyltransferase 1-like [Plakobranchus ocellatus]|uniref:Hexosyltransferase n=1 Tax=Plakobranchus ocellatus TaxID=259542 RepID=A0AAV4AAT5_9GAST|nr:beta-1,3-galactosyltransferase 1-like [Plakobranchus ocellatus]
MQGCPVHCEGRPGHIFKRSLLLTFLKYHGKSNAIFGFVYKGGSVNREGRWAVSEEVYPLDSYPVYASGTSYIISRSAAVTLMKLCSHYPYFPIEDAFITGILATVGSIDRVHMRGVCYWAKLKPEPCAFVNDKIYIGNNMTETELRSIWRLQIDRGRSMNCEKLDALNSQKVKGEFDERW